MPGMAAIFVVATVTASGRASAAALTTDVLDDGFDVRSFCGRAHGVFILGTHFLNGKFRRKNLGNEGVGIFRGKFIRAAVDDRRRGVPFESRSLPGINGSGLA